MYELIQNSGLQNASKPPQVRLEPGCRSARDKASERTTPVFKCSTTASNPSISASASGCTLSINPDSNRIDQEYQDEILCQECYTQKDNPHGDSRLVHNSGNNPVSYYESAGSPLRSPPVPRYKKRLQHSTQHRPYDSKLMSIVSEQIYPYYKKHPHKRRRTICSVVGGEPDNDSGYYHYSDNVSDDNRKLVLKASRKHPFQAEDDNLCHVDSASDNSSKTQIYSDSCTHRFQHNPLIRQVSALGGSSEILDDLIDIDSRVIESLTNGTINKTLFLLSSSTVQNIVMSWCKKTGFERPEIKSLYAELSRAMSKRNTLILKYINPSSERSMFNLNYPLHSYKDGASPEIRFDRHQKYPDYRHYRGLFSSTLKKSTSRRY